MGNITLYNMLVHNIWKFCCCSVTKLYPTLCDTTDCSMPGFPDPHYLLEFAWVHVHWIRDGIQPSQLCHFLLLPSIFPTLRVSSNELALHIRWPKYWSFSFSIGPSNEYSGLISFRIDWFDLLAVQGTLKSLFHHRNLKTSILQCSAFFQRRRWHPTPVHLPGKSHGWRSLVGFSPWGRLE